MVLNDVLINPAAYLKMIMHAKRFWNDKIPENKRAFAYGVLTGYVESDVRYILDYIPLIHSKYEIDFEKKHSIFMKIDRFNQDLAKEETMDYIIGWVRSIDKDEVEISEIDRKNQIYLQTAYQKQAITCFISVPSLDYDWGLSTWGYVNDISTMDENSLMVDLNWEFDEDADIDDLFTIMKGLFKVKGTKSPIIKEYKEVTFNFNK